MTDVDHGSGKALAGAFLQLLGGLLLATAMFIGFRDARTGTFSLSIGSLAALYFMVSGSVRLVVGVLTRRANS